MPSASNPVEGGVVSDRIREWNSLVDLADFAPYAPCGELSQCLSITRDSGSSSGRFIRVTPNGFISS